jgi:isopentenyl phosphate kinase
MTTNGSVWRGPSPWSSADVATPILVKLGGSLITDKRAPETPRLDVIARLAGEIAQALAQCPELSLVLGHVSGSFGHVVAERYGVHQGALDDWMGYAQTGAAAQRLNRLVVDALLAAGVRAVSLQPSASAICCEGELVSLCLAPMRELLAHGAVPLVYGDVAIDTARGAAIVSTEQVLAYVARNLGATRLVEVGEVQGVFTADPHRHPQARLLRRITPASLGAIKAGLEGSHGVDVTGGMRSKVELLLRLVQELPELRVQIIGGAEPGVLAQALVDGRAEVGTLLCADRHDP